MVADHLSRQPKDWTTGEVLIERVFLAGFGRRGRGLTERGAEDEAAKHRLGVPSATHEVDGQGVEEFGVGRQIALHAEVLAGGEEAGAEDLGPETVDDDA